MLKRIKLRCCWGSNKEALDWEKIRGSPLFSSSVIGFSCLHLLNTAIFRFNCGVETTSGGSRISKRGGANLHFSENYKKMKRFCPQGEGFFPFIPYIRQWWPTIDSHVFKGNFGTLQKWQSCDSKCRKNVLWLSFRNGLAETLFASEAGHHQVMYNKTQTIEEQLWVRFFDLSGHYWCNRLK